MGGEPWRNRLNALPLTDEVRGEALVLIMGNQDMKAALADKNTAEGTLINAVNALLKQAAAAALPPAAQPGATPASGGMAIFWDQLKHAVITGGFLQLAPGTYFLGSSINGSCLLVRATYERMTGHMARLLGEEGVTKLVITGSPGIGKSVFGWYLLWWVTQQAHAPPAIVLDQGPRDKVYCFLRDGPVLEAASLDSFHTYTSDPLAWLIVDGHKPPLKASAKTILITSPDHDVWWHFHKERGATVRYMPAWDMAELEACRHHMYQGHISSQELQRLYSRWGGRPRYVLEKAKDVTAQASLEAALARTSMLSLVLNLGGSGKDDKDSDRLLEIKVNQDFTGITYAFASPYVEGIVLQKLMASHKLAMRIWCQTATESQAGGLRGVIFEPLGHEALRAGGVFTIRRLEGRRSGGEVTPMPLMTLDLARDAQLVMYDSQEEVRAAPDATYCKPRRKNEASVDAIIQPDKLLQFTVSGSHSIKSEGLQYAVSMLRQPEKAMLIFVVPPDKYDAFKKQKVVSRGSAGPPPRPASGQQDTQLPSSGSSSEGGEPSDCAGGGSGVAGAGGLLDIPQYALSLDLSMEFGRPSSSRGPAGSSAARSTRPRFQSQVVHQHSHRTMQGQLLVRAPTRVARRHVAPARTTPAVGCMRC